MSLSCPLGTTLVAPWCPVLWRERGYVRPGVFQEELGVAVNLSTCPPQVTSVLPGETQPACAFRAYGSAYFLPPCRRRDRTGPEQHQCPHRGQLSRFPPHFLWYIQRKTEN